MMKDTLTKHYPYLTGQERFQLYIKAAAEGNTEEEDRLVKTCPKKDYRMLDATFLNRIAAALTLMTLFALDLAHTNGQLQLVIQGEIVLKGYMGMLSFYEAGCSATDGKGSPPNIGEKDDEPLEKELKTLEVARKSLQETVKACWGAFSKVCLEDMGLEPELVLSAFFPPALEWLEIDLTEDTIVNDTIKGKYDKLFREIWQKHVRD